MNPSIIIPSHNRPNPLLRCLDSIRRNTPQPYQVVVVSEDAMVSRLARAGNLMGATLIVEGGTAVEKWNSGATFAEQDWVVMLGDDTVVLPDWWTTVRRTPNKGFVGLNEGVTWTEDVGHWAIAQHLMDGVFNGALALPPYRIWWFDQELCAVLRSRGLYARTQEVVLTHYHPGLGVVPVDRTHTSREACKLQDGLTFKRRQAAGFPVDWEPIVRRNYETAHK